MASPEGISGTAVGGQLEEKVDYTTETNLALAQCTSLLAIEDDDDDAININTNTKSISIETIHTALQILYTIEKRCRIGNDTNNLIRIVNYAIEMCYNYSNTTTTSNSILLETITTIVTKRSQKMNAIRAVVLTALPWCIDMTLPPAVVEDSKDNSTTNSPDIATTTASSTTPTTASTTPTTTMYYKPISKTTQMERKNRNDLILCLRTITTGKLYLEREHAQLTRTLAYIYEHDTDELDNDDTNNVEGIGTDNTTTTTTTTSTKAAMAADILQEVHVETYGTLSKKEKMEYILEQLRCTIYYQQDYIRASIVANKINPSKQFLDANTDMMIGQYKIQYYTLLSKIHRHRQNESERNALDLVKDYHAIYLTQKALLVLQKQQQQQQQSKTHNNDTMMMMMDNDDGKDSNDAEDYDDDDIDDDNENDVTTTTATTKAKLSPPPPVWMQSFKAVIIFLLLSPYSNEQQDILHHICNDSNFEKVSTIYQSIVQMLLKKEIIQYPIPHLKKIESMDVLMEDGLQSYWSNILYRRIIQYNIRVVALYYQQIHLQRLGQLLHLPKAVVEEEIANMVFDNSNSGTTTTSTTIYAKINRPADIVTFQKPQSSTTILTVWSSQIESLLHLVETTTHLIHKEQMTSLATSK